MKGVINISDLSLVGTVKEFEGEFSDLLDFNLFGFTSGTDTQIICLKSLKIRFGDGRIAVTNDDMVADGIRIFQNIKKRPGEEY